MAAGILWNTLFDGNELNIRKTLYGSLLIRDYNVASTSLTGFTPFDSDGNLVSGLLEAGNPGGRWYDVGYLDDKGVQFRPRITTDKTEVFQSRQPARADYTKDEWEISFTCQESTPLVHMITQNASLANVPAVGSGTFAVGRPMELDVLYRQLLFIGVDGHEANNDYLVLAFPRVTLTDIGTINSNAKKVYNLDLTFDNFPDPYTVSPDGIAGAPVIFWEDGPLWRSRAGVQWPSPQTAPVATAGTGGAATISLSQPSLGAAPFTYAVTQTTGAVSSAATISGTPTVSGNTVTIDVTGLTSGDSYTFTVTATDTNGLESAPSLPSNAITAT